MITGVSTKGDNRYWYISNRWLVSAFSSSFSLPAAFIFNQNAQGAKFRDSKATRLQPFLRCGRQNEAPTKDENNMVPVGKFRSENNHLVLLFPKDCALLNQK